MIKKETARKWYKQALHDLDMAEKNIEIDGYDISAFLSHQAVEKLLKAGFILEGSRVPKYEEYTKELADEKVMTAKKVLEYFQTRWGEP